MSTIADRTYCIVIPTAGHMLEPGRMAGGALGCWSPEEGGGARATSAG